MKFEIWVLIKGMLMGAADIVPGVSGGTVAFITGIYERLLYALKSFLPALFSFFRHKMFKRFLDESDGVFLVTLFSGILVSVVSLATVISFMMENYPIPLWSSFFGLILASIFIVAKDVNKWTFSLLVGLVFGCLLAWSITQVTPTSLDKNAFTILASGMLAICAMVLPGISGSFILVILGSYAWILEAIKEFEFATLGLFCAGCLIGLLSIANLLSWAFDKYKALTLSILIGFMIGAMPKIWPWKQVVSYRENSKGELVPLVEAPIMPSSYELLSGVDAQVYLASACMFLAIALVFTLSSLVKKR